MRTIIDPNCVRSGKTEFSCREATPQTLTPLVLLSVQTRLQYSTGQYL